MKIALDVKAGDLSQARSWVTQNDEKLILLENWLKSQEVSWGECYVFIETYFPPPLGKRGNYRPQVDFIISFNNRVAVCEIKSHPWNKVRAIKKNKIPEFANQIKGQINIITHYLPDLDRKGIIVPLLLMPNASIKPLEYIWSSFRKEWESPHILITNFCSDLDKYNFIKVLGNRFEINPNRFKTVFNSQEQLYNLLIKEKRKFRYFNQFIDLVNYLSSIRPGHYFDRPEYYFREFRENEINEICNVFYDKKIIEINGPHGIGKSSFIQELIQEIQNDGKYIGYEYEKIPLRKCNSVDSICYTFFEVISGKVPPYSTEILLEKLSNFKRIYWVLLLDQASENSLRDFINELLKLPEDHNSLWIFEAAQPIFTSGISPHFSYQLKSISRSDIYCILQKTEPGGVFNDINEVIDWSNGNPGFALNIWRSKYDMKNFENIMDRYSWYNSLFVDEEKRILNIICFLFQKWPLGLSFYTLFEILSKDNYFISNKDKLLQDAVVEIIEKIEQWELIKLDKINQHSLQKAFDEEFPIEHELIIISWVDPLLLSRILNKFDEKQKSYFKSLVDDFTEEHIDNMFSENESRSNLTYVTMRLVEFNELWPFFCSTFRNTHRYDFINWIENNVEKIRKEDEYCYKALLAMQKLRESPLLAKDDIENLIDKPNKKSDREIYAFFHVIASSVARMGSYDAFLSKAVKNIKDHNFKAELLMRMAQRYALINEKKRAWNILQKLYEERSTYNENVQALILFQMLVRLNRKKVIEKIFPISVASQKIKEISFELIKLGAKLENYRLIYDALFYYARSYEYVEGKIKSKNVVKYLSILEDVEKISPQRQLQAVLTQGSVHRHYCRDDSVDWDDFYDHMNIGIILYERAFEKANISGIITHQLNSLSYIMHFISMSLRYVKKEISDDYFGKVKSKAVKAYELHKLLTKNLIDNEIMTVENQTLMRNIKFEYAMILTIIKRTSNYSIEDIHYSQSIKSFVDTFIDEFNQLLENRASGKDIHDLFRNGFLPTTRALEFSKRYLESNINNTNEKIISKNDKNDLLDLANKTELFCKKSKNKAIKRYWKMLNNLLQ